MCQLQQLLSINRPVLLPGSPLSRHLRVACSAPASGVCGPSVSSGCGPSCIFNASGGESAGEAGVY